MRFESPNQLSATTIGAGNAKPRRRNAAKRSSSITRAHVSLSRHGAPGPTGSGRRMAKSTGTTKRPSPTTTSNKSPSMPDNTRLCWPLHHLPTNANCVPYLWNTESSQTQVHCQRLWVAGLVSCTWRQIGSNTSSPRRLSRLSQERLGSAPSRREGQCLSHPRTRQSSDGSSPPPPSDNVLISGGLVRFLEPLCTHVISYDYLVFYFMSDIIKPCILRSFPIALRRRRSCCASRFVTVTRSASAPWPTCPIGSPRAWRPCVGLSGANSIISPVGTLSVVRSLVSSMR